MRLQTTALRCERGGRVLFSGVTLDVEAGRTVAVMGPSGSGKSQLLRMLARLDADVGGALMLDGRTPAQWGAAAWRAEVAYVAQRPAVLAHTPAEHAAAVAGLRAQRDRAHDDPVALAGAWGLPPAVWNRRWETLSGGEQQRAALALVVSRRPSVLLLDEPTSALDEATAHAVERSLAGYTAVWVTHDRQQALRVGSEIVDLDPSSDRVA